jgi:hypothetical protein
MRCSPLARASVSSNTPTPGYDGLDELITASRLAELVGEAAAVAWDAEDRPFEVIDLAGVAMGSAEAEAVLLEQDGYDLRTRHQLVSNALDVVLGSGGESFRCAGPQNSVTTARRVMLCFRKVDAKELITKLSPQTTDIVELKNSISLYVVPGQLMP